MQTPHESSPQKPDCSQFDQRKHERSLIEQRLKKTAIQMGWFLLAGVVFAAGIVSLLLSP